MRVVPEVNAFLKQMQDAGKPFAAICHAPWGLISAGLVKGRTLTGYHTIQDDIRNAGGKWVDREVVEDGNWVTGRQRDDIPAFSKAMLRLFAGSLAGAARWSAACPARRRAVRASRIREVRAARHSRLAPILHEGSSEIPSLLIYLRCDGCGLPRSGGGFPSLDAGVIMSRR
jgi:hypothetical protein